MLKRIPIIIFFFGFLKVLSGQSFFDCGLPSPPPEDECPDACIYCDLTSNGYIGSTDGYTPDLGTFECGTEENSQWLAFVAGSSTVEFTVTPSNCTDGSGVQVAVFTDCEIATFFDPIVCEPGDIGLGTTPMIATADGLVVGEVYLLMVDGYLGDICDFTIEVTQGNTDPPPLPDPGPISPTTGGTGTVTYSVPPIPDATSYTWTLPDGTEVTGPDPFVDYTYGVVGDICVQTSGDCTVSPEVCITIPDVDCMPEAGMVDLSTTLLCPGELATITITDHNSDLSQDILITDSEGIILEIFNGSFTDFTRNECGEFQVCSYNYNDALSPMPAVGNDINNIDCSIGCCDLQCESIVFQDTELPVFTNAPDDMTVACFDLLPPMIDLSWTDNCDGSGTVTGVETGNADLCNGGIVFRNWVYMDNCENTNNFQQTITVDPTPAISFVDLPADLTVVCDDLSSVSMTLAYTNNGIGNCLIDGTASATITGSYDECGGQITYTWETPSTCSNPIIHAQEITIDPLPEPTFINYPDDITIDCSTSFPQSTPLDYSNNLFDNCEIAGTEFSTIEVINSMEQEYTWIYTNPCGSIDLIHTQIITQSPAPNIELDIDIVTICQGESFDLITIDVFDINNTNATITYHSDTPADPSNEILLTEVMPVSDEVYYILATNQDGCTDEAFFDIIVEVPPFAGIDGNETVCYNISDDLNLFEFLGGTPDIDGNWIDVNNSGVDLSNPMSVNLSGFPPGFYIFEYNIASNGICPAQMSSITLELLPEILIDVVEITCTDDLDFYSLIVNTNGFEIDSDAGMINDIGGAQIEITNIPIDINLSIYASNIEDQSCEETILINPPNCDCPNINPPISNGPFIICEGDVTPELSVVLEINQTANWYDSPINGSILISESSTYTPTGNLDAGISTFYVETQEMTSGCLSSIFTPVELIVYENPIANNTTINLCDDGDGFVSFDLESMRLHLLT